MLMTALSLFAGAPTRSGKSAARLASRDSGGTSGRCSPRADNHRDCGGVAEERWETIPARGAKPWGSKTSLPGDGPAILPRGVDVCFSARTAASLASSSAVLGWAGRFRFKGGSDASRFATAFCTRLAAESGATGWTFAPGFSLGPPSVTPKCASLSAVPAAGALSLSLFRATFGFLPLASLSSFSSCWICARRFSRFGSR
mmetsp:Transcript_8403/g.21660  ORF Transcript_8403/g.21660 Transcript_8403/m.21660 type:complete len:201 (+) Transcript_8403:1255-1857(+)